MKTLLKLGFAVIAMLFVLTACALVKDITVGWAIISTFEEVDPVYHLPDSFVDINYDVSNGGKYDLDGVKLHFRLYVGANTYDFASPAFTMTQGQTIRNNVIVVDILPYHLGVGDFAEVISIDMDRPTN
jgi:hypothetical protein